MFVRDPVPARSDARPLTNVPNTPDGLAGWFARNTDFVVSKPERVMIGHGLAAMTFTISVSPAGQNDDPDCLGQNHDPAR